MIINSEEGLKSRTAAILVQLAGRFECQVLIECENKKINAKSIMGVLSLKIQHGESIYVLTNGKDERQAMEAIEELITGEMEEVE